MECAMQFRVHLFYGLFFNLLQELINQEQKKTSITRRSIY